MQYNEYAVDAGISKPNVTGVVTGVRTHAVAIFSVSHTTLNQLHDKGTLGAR